MALGFSLLHEEFDVSDFATINTAGSQTLPDARVGTQTDTARIDWWGSLLTGYGNRPYSGTTGVVRAVLLLLEPADDASARSRGRSSNPTGIRGQALFLSAVPFPAGCWSPC